MTRVLVVEDDPQLVRALVINVQARHYGVDAAPDGAMALRLAAARQPDAVLLDLGLPDMDGVDIIKALRGWSRVPIQEAWGVSRSGKTNYLRVYMAQLRRKLETDPSHPRY